MTNKDDFQIQAIHQHQNSKVLHSVPKPTERSLHEAGTIDNMKNVHIKAATWKARTSNIKYKELVKDKSKDKAVHGKFPRYLGKDYMNTELSFQWMKYTALKGGTEGLITAAKDKSLNTRYNGKHISKQGTTDTCRMCHNQPETGEHNISGGQILAADKYFNRHNQVAVHLYLDICKHYNIKEDAQHWYQHNPERIIENEKVTILWDFQITPGRHVPCNKPDINIQEKESDRCMIIDVAIPSDYNFQRKTTEKMSKYVDLHIEFQKI